MSNPAPGFEKYPDYQIDLTPEPGTVTLHVAGEVIARSSRAVHLAEQRHAPVLYMPREDLIDGFFESTDHTTYCPFKGTATYLSIRAGDIVLDNAVWCYAEPYDEMEDIRGYVSFYMDRIDDLQIDGASSERHKPRILPKDA